MANVIVIGGGPGGYVAAIRLAQLGQTVIVIEKEQLGGVCLNWGCIPSKALIHAARLYDEIHKADRMGIHVDGLHLDVPRLQQWKEGVVQTLTGGIRQLLKAQNVKIIQGEAVFQDAHTLKIYTDRTASSSPLNNENEIPSPLAGEGEGGGGEPLLLKADYFIIATGSVPVEIPGFKFNGHNIVESKEALSWQAIPKTLAILGGGVIGLEMGTLYAKLGSQVTVIEAMAEILPEVDTDLRQVLLRSLKKRKITVHMGTMAKSAVANENGVEVTFGEQSQTFEKLLVCVGRKPNSAGLGLEKAGVKTDVKGFIQVDNQLKTSIPHIFAIGDITGPPLLAHKASKEGLIAAAVIAGEKDIVDYRAMPAAIFCDPEIAMVGLTEAQATAAGYEIKVGRFPFAASGRALSMNASEGLVKVVTDAKTDAVLGVHMVGTDVSELIAEAALGIEMGATAEDFALTVHTHPTLPEALMEAAEAVHGRAIHIR